MANARERLTHLVELASQSAPEKQRGLAIELCDLLLDWPADYSREFRAPFEALMERIVRGLDVSMRRQLAARLASSPDTPVDLLNEFFFDVSLDAKIAILARNDEASEGHAEPVLAGDLDNSLMSALRTYDRAGFASALGEALGIDAVTAEHILDDHSAEALAVACKGAHLTRATYSSMALLANGTNLDSLEASYARLGIIDGIPEAGAERMLKFWRVRHEPAAAPEPHVEPAEAYASA